jgi:hypothetical protein
LSDCPGQVKMAPNLSDRASENDSVICQFLKSKIINIELFSVGSRGKFYLNIASYVSCILRYFVDYGIPLSQIKIVLFILANRECLIRRRRCINIVFIFGGQWKVRVICGVLILENYPWCVLPLRSKYWKRDRLPE